MTTPPTPLLMKHKTWPSFTFYPLQTSYSDFLSAHSSNVSAHIPFTYLHNQAEDGDAVGFR